MSGDAASLPCPLCLNSGFFNTVQTLRDRLISVSTSKMICPVCQEEVFGLDKLTIHLFSHVKLQNIGNCDFKEQKSKLEKPTQVQINTTETNVKKKTKVTPKNKSVPCTSNDPLQYVKIYPKLPTVSQPTLHLLDPSSQKIKEELCNSPHGSSTETSNSFCNQCGLQFVNIHILRMHKCLIHNIVEKTNEESNHHKCHICPKHFKMRGSLMVHLRVAHFGYMSNSKEAKNETSIMTGDKNEEQSLAATETAVTTDKIDNKQWQCDVCRKNFTTKYFLKKHKRLHTGETPYACSQCNKTFTFQQSYHKHLLYHNDEKPHVCNYCGRAFKELSTLHNHQRIHTGEKPFSCETCGKCFRQRVSYLVHRRIHTGVMPYKCTACNKSFRYKVSQRTHKCLAQPPGMVIRQGGELLEKLKKKQSNPEDQASIYVEVSEASAELVRTGAQLSLEDTVTENFTLIPESFERKDNSGKNIYSKDSPNHNTQEFLIDKNVPSPSEIMKNLCLSNDETISENSDNNLQKETNLDNFDLFNEFNVFL